MYAGRVVETGPAELIRRSPRHPYTKALHDAVPADHPRDRRLAARGAGQLGGEDAQVNRDSCVFAGRCPRVQDRCRQERPPMTEEDSLRSYACFYPV
jgi:oligopeptide/dipeptide ABC transporter ATP-binding protein